MTALEDRLRDVFASLDEQIAVPPMRTPSRRVDVRLIAAAAVVMIAGGLLAASLTDPEPAEIGVAADMRPADFDAAAGDICRALISDISGVAPRFATVEAYIVSAKSRIAAIDVTAAAISSMPPPSDDLGLTSRVLSRLRAARARGEHVVVSAEAGRLGPAQRSWAEIDWILEQARVLLGDHGAKGCRP